MVREQIGGIWWASLNNWGHYEAQMTKQRSKDDPLKSEMNWENIFEEFGNLAFEINLSVQCPQFWTNEKSLAQYIPN